MKEVICHHNHATQCFEEIDRLKMSKREYFAGQALQGFFSGIPFDPETPMTEADDKYLQEVARVCFKMADAMIAKADK